MNDKKFDQLFALFLILAGMAVRLLPHPANMTPLTALALFSGTVLSPGAALLVPVAAMVASDLWIGAHDLFWVVWGSFILVVLLGFWVKQNPRGSRIFMGTLAGSLLFFLLTNLGVFLFENMYPKNFAGLNECFAMALPFFRNSILGDLFYSALLFGIYHLVKNKLVISSEANGPNRGI